MRIICLLAALFVSLHGNAQTFSRLIPKKGWFATTHELTWTAGSEVNFFSADKKQHHYYFTWWEQDADSSVKGRDVLYIGSSNTAVHGTYILQQQGPSMQSSLQCKWNLAETGIVHITHIKLWLPFFRNATWLVNGVEQSIDQLSAFNDTALQVKTSFGHFKLKASHPFRIQRNDDARPATYAYESRSQFLQLHESDIRINNNDSLRRNFVIEEIEAVPAPPTATSVLNASPIFVSDAWDPSLPPQTVLPQPKKMALTSGYYILPRENKQPSSSASATFHAMLQDIWQTDAAYYPNINAKENSSLPKEGYLLQIDEKEINLQYKNEAGLQHALYTLLQLVQPREGSLVIPTGTINDYPSIDWRGIHMFTGPTSWPLHKRMYERVLLPLKMNKVVLQCEQAEWKSFPNIHNNISVPLADLKAEFDYLRKKQVEPIPLIQSLGHMEWFFKPTENRFMAVNPEYPYTLDPTLPASRLAVKKIWDEAFQLLNPKVMHIGFDEIGMIGFHLPREKEIDYWKMQLSFLNNYAKKKKATLMLWGDMGLAPGEGPDALNGINKERAALLRSTIPAGSYVADWHYIANPNPEVYLKNLRIWKENKNIPVASPWLRDDNVRGFVLAAKQEGAGVLQTTWADFESSEKNMLLNIEQFGAYVLAMDYAWSGRTELPKDLPYRATEEWTTRFYSEAKPVDKRSGMVLPNTISLRNITIADKYQAPETAIVKLAATNASGLRMKMTTDQIVQEGTELAQVSVFSNDKLVGSYTLRYGVELRSVQDQRNIFACIPGKDGKTLYRFFEKQYPVTSIRIQLLHHGSGLNIEEWMLIE